MTPDNEIELLDYQPSMIELDVLRGRFTGITYFMTTMSLSECIQQLRYLNLRRPVLFQNGFSEGSTSDVPNKKYSRTI